MLRLELGWLRSKQFLLFYTEMENAAMFVIIVLCLYFQFSEISGMRVSESTTAEQVRGIEQSLLPGQFCVLHSRAGP